jgi:hypothetical protein
MYSAALEAKATSASFITGTNTKAADNRSGLIWLKMSRTFTSLREFAQS